MDKKRMLILSEIYHHLDSEGYDLCDTIGEFLRYEQIQSMKEGRRLRFTVRDLSLQICDGDFDRWANSVGRGVYLKELTYKSFVRSLARITKGVF